MDKTSTTFRPETLLAHREWVERAARALVYGDADAEDLQQQVWLEILERPPAGEPASPRGWLWSVLRFTAIDAGRSAKARSRHEEAAARPERIDATPAELVARAETLNRVAHAVLELEEPYRATVLLRYFEGLEARAIADLQGIPVETVRTRLKRAVARLRERLDAENGGKRRSWVLALLPLLRRPSTGTGAGAAGMAASTAAGVLIMGIKTKTAVAAATLVLGVAGFLLRQTWRETIPQPLAQVSHATEAAAPGPARGGSAPAATLATPTAPRPFLVLGPDGKPAAGALLSFVASGKEAEPPLPLGTTGPDGRAPWPEGNWPLPGLLRAERAGFAPGDAAVTHVDVETVIRLGAGFVLDGLVVRRADSAPVPDAAVRIQYDRFTGPLGPFVGIHGTFTASVRSGPDGAFRFPGLATPSSALLTVTAEGFAETRVYWGSHKPRLVRVEMDRPLPLRILLRDRAGKPLPGGAVALGRDPRTMAWRDGMFQFAWVPLRDLGDGLYGAEGLAPGWYSVAGGHEGFRPADGGRIGLREGVPPAEIVLEPATGIRGRVVDDATGGPVAGVRLGGMPFLMGEGAPNVSWNNTVEAGVALGDAAGATSGPDGSFTLSSVSAGDPFLLLGKKEGYWPYQTRLAELDERTRTDDGSGYEVRLRPLGRIPIRGRILDEAGEPVAGAVIRWEGVLGLPSGAVAASPDGRFSVEDLSDGQYPVALAPGFFPTTLEAPSAVTGGDYGDIVLFRYREIRGRVVDPDGRPVPGLSIGIEPHPDAGGRAPGSPVVTRVVSSDGEGNLSIPVTPGREHSLKPLGNAPWTGEVTLPADTSGPFTLVVRPKVPLGTGVVRGRALREDGTVLGEVAFAMVWPEGGDAPAPGVQPGMLAPDGTFTVEGVPAGTWKVVVQSGERNGETHGVALADGGTAEVTVTCTPRPKRDPAPPAVDLRVAPTGTAARAVTAWVTEGDRRSQPFRVKGEELVASVRSGEVYTAWLSDPAAGTAAVASRLDPRDAMPIPVSLAAAGRMVLGPRKDGKERWIVVRDTAGNIPWSNLETSLPGVAGKGYVLLLPPGEYEVTLALGIARREADTRKVVVRVGVDTAVE